MQKFLLILLNLAFLSVSGQSKNQFVIEGVIDSTEKTLYYITYKHKSKDIKDSIVLDKDKAFRYTGHIEEPTRVFFSIKDRYDPRIVGDFVVYQMFVEPGKLHKFHGFRGWRYSWKNRTITNSKTEDLSAAWLLKLEQTQKDNRNGLTEKMNFIEKIPVHIIPCTYSEAWSQRMKI